MILLNEIFILYICILCILSIFLTVYDKGNAKKARRRVSEKVLLLCAAFGGAAVMYITMLLIRHKTKHVKFMVLLPLMIVIHIVLLYFILKHIGFRAG